MNNIYEFEYCDKHDIAYAPHEKCPRCIEENDDFLTDCAMEDEQ